MNNQTLDELYKEAIKLIKYLDSGELLPKSHEFMVKHRHCLDLFTECAARLEKLDLFSSNEELDDVGTGEMKYLYLNYFFAKCIEKTPIDVGKTTLVARATVAKFAARKYYEFAYTLSELGLNKNKLFGQDLNADLPHGPHGMFKLNISEHYPASVRDVVPEKLELIEEEINVADNEYFEKHESESAYRNVELKHLKYLLLQAWHNVRSIIDELRLLNRMLPSLIKETMMVPPNVMLSSAEMQRVIQSAAGPTFSETREELDNRTDTKFRHHDFSTKVESTKSKLLGPKNEVTRPFVLLPSNTRQDVLDQVQGTGQQLPTMTIDQLVEKEMQNMAIGTTNTTSDDWARVPADKREILGHAPSDDSDDDELRLKLRNWDDFKETVHRGSGNTMNLG